MKQFISAFLLWCPMVALQAQEGKPASYFDRKQRVEIGLNITNTLSSFVGSSSNGSTNDPYLLSLRVGSSKKRLRLGLNFSLTDKSTAGTFGPIDETGNEVRARAGYEWVVPVSARMGFYTGADAIFEWNTNEVQSFTTGGIATLQKNTAGFGAGPVLGFVWRVHPRVALTTETSIYGLYRGGKETVSAAPDFREQKIHDFVFQPLIPTSLYVNFIF